MRKTEPTRALVNRTRLMVAGIFLLAGLLLICVAEGPSVLKWGLLVLLLLPTSAIVLLTVLPVFFRQKCASCGVFSYDRLSCFDQCPHCGGLFGEVDGLMPRDGVFHLDRYLDDGRSAVKLIGMILTMAIRDGVKEVRLVGHCEEDDPECPWDASHRLWRIWLTLKGKAHEMVPPPRHVGTSVFLLLKEVYRRTKREDTGPARFHIAMDDYSESVELILAESEEEELAKIVFTSEAIQPWEGARRHLEEVFSRVGN